MTISVRAGTAVATAWLCLGVAVEGSTVAQPSALPAAPQGGTRTETDCRNFRCLYVDPDHPAANDATSTNDNSASRPWATIGRALWGSTNRDAPNRAQAATAGDIVRIRCGRYTTTGTNQNGFVGIALSPVNQGTATKPLRMQSYDNEFACIDIVFTSGYGSAIGTQQKNYVHWSGFNLNENNIPWNAAVFGHQSAQVWIGGDPQAVGNLVENTRLRGTATGSRDGDNYTVLRLHGTDRTTIRNVHISDVGGTDENSGCILWYYSTGVTVEHSTLENCGSGIYMKGDNPPSPYEGPYTIRFNRFSNNHYGLIALRSANATPEEPGLIYQNIFEGGTQTFRFNHYSDITDPNDLKVINNVFAGASEWCVEISGNFTRNAGVLYQNNICVSAGGPAFGSGSGGTNVTSFEPARFLARHNVYQNVSSRGFALDSVSFANWRSNLGQDNVPPIGLVTNDRLFADEDYHPAPGSPALNHGRAVYGVGGADGTPVNAGPYINGDEVIGHTE